MPPISIHSTAALTIGLVAVAFHVEDASLCLDLSIGHFELDLLETFEGVGQSIFLHWEIGEVEQVCRLVVAEPL